MHLLAVLLKMLLYLAYTRVIDSKSDPMPYLYLTASTGISVLKIYCISGNALVDPLKFS